LEEDVVFLLDLGILAVSSLALSLVFARLHLSVVPGQIIAGMIVGPYLLNLVTNVVILKDISTIGIVLLLFIIGLELDPVELRRLLGKIVVVTFIEVTIAFAFGLLAAYLLHFSFLQSIIFAMISSITSTAIVGKTFLERRALHSRESGLFVGLLVIEDIMAVIFLILLSSFSSFNSPTNVQIAFLVEEIVGGFALVGASYAVARYLAPPIINYLSHYEEEFEEIPFLFSLGLGFLFAVLGAYIGYSPGIGAFIIGLSIRGKHSKFISAKIAPIKDLFLVLFFVSMGSLIAPIPALVMGLPVAAILILLILGKFLGGALIGRMMLSKRSSLESKEDEKRKNGDLKKGRIANSAFAFGSWLVPRGEFSLVMAQLALSVGLVSEQFFSLVGFSVLVTAIVGSILQKAVEPQKASTIFPIKGKQDDEERGIV
jgi:CPA2 family monovalent cation:H+ antiporter-2